MINVKIAAQASTCSRTLRADELSSRWMRSHRTGCCDSRKLFTLCSVCVWVCLYVSVSVSYLTLKQLSRSSFRVVFCSLRRKTPTVFRTLVEASGCRPAQDALSRRLERRMAWPKPCLASLSPSSSPEERPTMKSNTRNTYPSTTKNPSRSPPSTSHTLSLWRTSTSIGAGSAHSWAVSNSYGAGSMSKNLCRKHFLPSSSASRSAQNSSNWGSDCKSWLYREVFRHMYSLSPGVCSHSSSRVVLVKRCTAHSLYWQVSSVVSAWEKLCILEQYVAAQLASGKDRCESGDSPPHNAEIMAELFGRKQCLKAWALSDLLPSWARQLSSTPGPPAVSPDSWTHRSSMMVWLKKW